MLNMRLRGYVTPEDFVGTDTQRIQQALDTSAKYDIGRVVLKGAYTVEETLYIAPMTDLVLEDATVTAAGDFPVLANRNLAETDKHNWTFQDQYITIRGSGKFQGEVLLYNGFHVNIDGIDFEGGLRFSFTREVRLFNSRFTGNKGLVLHMGSNNFIIQNLTANCTGPAVVLDATVEEPGYVIGKEAEIHDIILQDSCFHTPASAVTLRGNLDARIYNMQFDHLTSDGVTLEVGRAGEEVPEESYFNLTAELLTSGAEKSIVVNNAVKHCYFPG